MKKKLSSLVLKKRNEYPKVAKFNLVLTLSENSFTEIKTTHDRKLHQVRMFFQDWDLMKTDVTHLV